MKSKFGKHVRVAPFNQILSCEGVRPFDLRIASSSLVRGSLKASISLTIISARLCIFGLGFDSIRAKNLPRVETSSFM